jgi:hypothetical protein
MKFPASSNELLDEIIRLCPERLPTEGETMQDFNRYVGKRELVLQLINARNQAIKAAARPIERSPSVRR